MFVLVSSNTVSLSLQCEHGIVADILVSILKMLFQWTGQFGSEHIRVDELFVLVYEFGDREPHIWNVVLHGKNENRNYFHSYLVLCQVRHDDSKRVKTTDSIVVSFFVYFVRR